MPSLEPDAKLTVILTAAEWNVVLAQLAEGPYRIVAPLMKKITDQGMGQAVPVPAPNGFAEGETIYVPDR